MLGIRYLKAPNTIHVFHYSGGRLVKDGPGLSFFYFGPTSLIVQAPLSSVDVPFVFNETTADFQEATVQGNVTYRVADPKKLVSLLDYSVDAHGRYRTDDPTKLSERLTQAAHVRSRAFVQRRPLRELLTATAELSIEIAEGMKQSESLARLGVDTLDVAVLAIRPTPEMAKALEAEAREKLLKAADEAVYARRNASVELERTIKENELRTELLVEQKNRELRETKIQADIAVEQNRAQLVAAKAENDRKEAEVKAAALAAMLGPVKDVDWRTLVAIGGGDSKTFVSMAFDQLAQKAEKIGQLNITPDLLGKLLQDQVEE